MQNQSSLVAVEDLGICRYAQAWQKQQDVHAAVVAATSVNTVLVVEHPPVVTFGKHASAEHLLVSPAILQARGIDVVHTDRGGEVTGHEPGQLVVYPILRLGDFRLSPRKYVCLLETAVMRTLSKFGITSTTDPDNPGVWVGEQKLCAVGIRIKQRVTMHGIALNVCNDLEVFNAMVPCGISGRSVTSIAALTGKDLSTAIVKSEFLKIFLESLEKTVAHAASAALPIGL